jgi:preprotein translocase subunit SecE
MAVEAARPNLFIRLRTFYHDVVAELKRVTWPDKLQVRSATIGILIFVLLVGFVITLMDLVLQTVLVRWLPRLFS